MRVVMLTTFLEMMLKMDKQQKAFPGTLSRPDGGMDLRDYFAAAVITGIMPDNVLDIDKVFEAANNAYKIADAMIEAREK